MGLLHAKERIGDNLIDRELVIGECFVAKRLRLVFCCRYNRDNVALHHFPLVAYQKVRSAHVASNAILCASREFYIGSSLWRENKRQQR